MAMMNDPQYAQIRKTVDGELRTKLVSDLKSTLKDLQQPVSGTKAALHSRILQHLDLLHSTASTQRFHNAVEAIMGPKPSSRGSSFHLQPTYSTFKGEATKSTTNGYRPSFSHGIQSPAARSTQPKFANTPFYSIGEALTSPKDLPVMQTNRHNVFSKLTLTQSVVDRLRSDQDLRIMLYCTGDLSQSSSMEISFPSQIEIRVNDTQYTGNLRGVKKKPGTTRPADITPLCKRAVPGVINDIHITYAATDKLFTFVVYLVKKHPVIELVERVKRGQVISRQSVINEMINKSKDPDIVTTSTVMSLKCPLSAMRMKLPCRSTICNHNQCFDAESFLQLQEQAPQWSCPTCNKVFSFEALMIDDYVRSILQQTNHATEQVTIEPNGNWKPGIQSNSAQFSGSSQKSLRPLPDPSGNDDLVEIADMRIMGSKQPSSTPSQITPCRFGSREASSAATTQSASSKRKRAEVIDLTISSDEEEEELPHRPYVKRQSTGFLGSTGPNSQSNSVPGLPTSTWAPQQHQPQEPQYPWSISQGPPSQQPYHSPLSSPPNYPGRYWNN